MTTPTTGPLNSPKAQSTIRNRIKKRDAFVNLALKDWLETPGGRLLLFWLLEDVCDVDGGSFVPSSNQTAFNEGVRAAGIKIRDRVMKTVPGLYVSAMEEELIRRENELKVRDAEASDLGDNDE